MEKTAAAARFDIAGLQIPSDLQGIAVTVMGLGLFGGGAGVTRFLSACGARVTVTDLKAPELLAESVKSLEGTGARLVLGEHRVEDFTGADLVIANPAVPPDSPYLVAAREANVLVDSEINLLFRLLPTPHVAGVTGSNGKTTTAHLVHRMVNACGRRAWLGGNVGGSLLPDLASIGAEDVVVLELSSFQLEMSGAAGLGPRVAVVTNLTPNHLDRHAGLADYAAAKLQIMRRARAAVLNAGDPLTRELIEPRVEAPIWRFSSRGPLTDGLFLEDGRIIQARGGETRKVLALRDITLPGTFNHENVMAALAAATLALGGGDVPAAAARAGAEFGGVPHRLELVARIRGARYINDSIATTPESTVAALYALEGKIALIAGGYDKRLPLDALAAAIAERASAVYLVGATAGQVEAAVRAAAGPAGGPELVRAGTLERAVALAAQRAGEGWNVLLSPAFASYDQFVNFVQRGDRFREYVLALTEKP